jgi:TatD DNase family protein
MIDAHLHLQHIPDRRVLETIFREAPSRGIRQFFCNAIKLEDCETLSEIASEYDSVVPFYGIHPWEARNQPGNWDAELEKCIREPFCGVGEIGLDKKKDPDLSGQVEVFTRQLEMAKEHKKPVMIHCVQAWGEMLPILRKNSSGLRFLIHSFRGSEEILAELMKLGAFVTFSWKLFHQKYGETPEKVAALIKKVPADRLLLETDFPYIGEKCFSTLTAEQYFECIKDTYATAAQLLGMSLKQLEEQVERNGKAFLH